MLYSKPHKDLNTASPTYKSIKITATAVLSAILLTIVVIAAFYIPAAIRHANQIQKAKSNIIRYTYSLAIDYRDKNGYHIPDSWLQDLRLNDFSYNSDNPEYAIVDKNGILKATESAAKGKKTTITYKLNGKIACVIYVNIVGADGYIVSESDLLLLNDSGGTFIQTEDIILSGSVSIKNFKGKYYGNHNVISGHDMGASGGLFDTASSAGFYGIVLTNVTGTISAAKDANYGALVNKGNNCKIEYCSVEGGFRVEGVSGINGIGGLAGYMYGSKRTANDDFNADYVNACTTKLDIEVEGEGAPRIGGVIGNAINMVISNTTVRGNINVTFPDAKLISKAYIGGFAGSLLKEYETAAYRINYLDSSYNLTSEGNINISLTGGGQSFNSVYAGGVFGSVVNQTVSNAKCTGSISVTGGSADLFIGGVAGYAQNEMSKIMSEGSIRLYIEKSEIGSPIKIESRGRLYAGGLVGYGIKIDAEDTVATVTPEVIGERENILTNISETIGFSPGA